MGKQITFYDRMQAFTRLADKGLAKEMTIKGSYINSLPKLYGMSPLKKSDDGHTFVSVGMINDIKKFHNKFFDPAITIIPPWEQLETYALPDKKKRSPSSLIRDGRYLVIGVDLSRGKTDITNDLHSLIDICSKYIKETKRTRKNKKHDVDIWKVFDQCNQPGFKNNKGQPIYVKVVRAFYKNISDKLLLDGHRNNMKRAYKKACDIVKQVEKDIFKEYKRV